MTALAIQAPGVSSVSVRTGKVYPPNCTNLEGLFFFGSSLAESVVNRSPLSGKADALVLGSPVVGAAYLTLTNQLNYLQSQIAETDNMTLIAWHTTEYLNFNAICNSWTTRTTGTGNSYGVALYTGGGGGASTGKQNYAAMGQKTSGQTTDGTRLPAQHTAVINGGLAGTYMTQAARFTPTTVRHDILTNGSGTTTASFTGGNERDKATGLLRFGSASVGGNNDAFNMAGAAIFSRALTDQELSEFYIWLAAREAVRGIQV